MKQKKILTLALIFLLIIYLLLNFPFQKAVVFYYENTNQMTAFLPIDQGDTFQIIFKHSIHLTDVVEKYRIREDDKIEQYEIVFEEFGIGMPSNAEKGEEFIYKDGKYHIKSLENIFPYMNIRNGRTVSEHRLVWGSKEERIVWFNQYFQQGAWYTVKVDDLSLWQLVKGVRIHD